MADRIRYGLRRYPLLVGLFLPAGVGSLAWSWTLVEPTYVFPLGTLEPGAARVAFVGLGLLAFAYVGSMSWVRYVRRPEIVLGNGEITVPLGEFGGRTATLRAEDVQRVEVVERAGGWRVLHVYHPGGVHKIPSSQLPDDAAFDRVYRRLRALAA